MKIEQDNSKMNADLHKTKELMPLLLSVVNGNQELLDAQTVEEFRQIYSEQMIAEGKEDINYKLLGTTGIKLLDAQLQHYMIECKDKGIHMDTFITEPVQQQMQKLGISQLQMQQLVGDLLRNAIRAIEHREICDGKILFIIGNKENVLEIDIFDNGVDIPLQVLEHFGERGITTGGTGNGLADVMEILTEYQASLVIHENELDASAYTKGLLIIFDAKSRRELVSCRRMEHLLKENKQWKINSNKSF